MKYIVTELDANEDGYTANMVSDSGEIEANRTDRVEFVNSFTPDNPPDNPPDNRLITPRTIRRQSPDNPPDNPRTIRPTIPGRA